MNHKVLLADDSLTIQKVIKITLANQPYDITDCMNEEELFHQVSALQPKLVFLDFNLSEQYTGYELTSKIKSASPTTKVLLLLGTFDSVDEAAMEKCGASDKIVKPFDSNKFIAICKHLIDTFADDEEIPYPKAKAENKFVVPDSSDEQWTVNHTTEQNFPTQDIKLDHSIPGIRNPLLEEVSDWGMSVPGIINDSEARDKVIDLPPIIGAAPKTEAPKHQVKFPETEDLDYPIENFPDPGAKSPASKLISIESFKGHAAEIEKFPSFEENDVSAIEAQIKDEVEEDLWQADEFEDLKREVSSKIEEAKNSFQPSRNAFDESLFKPLDDSESIDWNETQDTFSKNSQFSAFNSANDSTAPHEFNRQEVRGELEELVKKYVKEYMDEMFRKNVEKISWEIIPDLAENLIRQELTKISHKILNDQG